MNVSEFVKSAKAGIVTVTFKKINTDEIRVMPCTLNNDLLKEAGVPIQIKEIGADSDHIAVWSLDKKAWRSFRVSTVTEWSIGEPEEKVSNKGSDS